MANGISLELTAQAVAKPWTVPAATVSEGGTPRTDAETMEHTCEYGFHAIERSSGGSYVKATFARTLERELGERTKERDDWKQHSENVTRTNIERGTELTSLRHQLEEARKERDGLMQAAIIANQQLTAARATSQPEPSP